MRNDELRDQIEALRSEVRALGASFANLRQEDVRRALVEQVRPVLQEQVERAVASEADRDALRRAAGEWLEGALAALGSADLAALPRFLERSPARSVVRTGDRDEVRDMMDRLEAQLRSYQSTYDRALRTRGPLEGEAKPGSGALDPAAVEAIVAPLSNGRRIDLLRRLSRQEEGLAALSRAAGVQKGHLQFHIKVLMDAGYVDQDRKSRMYSITPRGERALDGLAALVEAIGPR